jgi:hypothetical protein
MVVPNRVWKIEVTPNIQKLEILYWKILIFAIPWTKQNKQKPPEALETLSIFFHDYNYSGLISNSSLHRAYALQSATTLNCVLS